MSTVWPSHNQVGDRLIEPDSVTLKVTFDSKGIAGTRGGDRIEPLLHPKPPIPDPAIEARVVDNDNGTYSASFPSVYPGPCVLSIEVNGKAIKGSGPFDITVHRDIRCIKGPNGYLEFPEQPGKLYGVAVSSNGKIFVSDEQGHKIHVFNKERKYITSFGTEERGEGQQVRPQGLTVDSDGLLYVATTGSCIEVFKEDGKWVRQILLKIENNCIFPRNFTIHNQHLYIADPSYDRLLVYTLKGQHVCTIGSSGSGPGQFSCPSGVAFSPDGDMYVTEYSNHRVQVFDGNGQLKREFGRDELKNPSDIVITSDGDVLVADGGVAVYSTCGNTNKFIHSFKVQGLQGLAIDNDGDILVTEYNNKLVLVF